MKKNYYIIRRFVVLRLLNRWRYEGPQKALRTIDGLLSVFRGLEYLVGRGKSGLISICVYAPSGETNKLQRDEFL